MFESERAFTVIELIVIIAVLGLISSFIVTNMRGFLDSYLLRVNTSEVLSLLRKTKQLAVTRSQNYGVELSNSCELGIYEVDGVGYLQKMELGSGITASHSRSTDKTIFYPLGNASSGTITLVSEQGYSYKIIISSTGRIRMVKV